MYLIWIQILVSNSNLLKRNYETISIFHSGPKSFTARAAFAAQSSSYYFCFYFRSRPRILQLFGPVVG
jgi:hypothetical protein